MDGHEDVGPLSGWEPESGLPDTFSDAEWALHVARGAEILAAMEAEASASPPPAP
jgi:hypothetical protein